MVIMLPETRKPRLYYVRSYMYNLRMKRKEFQADFIERSKGFGPMAQLFNMLPDVAFFVKDTKGRFVMQNKRCLEFSRVQHESEVIGKTDFDLFRKERADYYAACDREIIRTGKPILNAIEIPPDTSEKLVVCSKFPVYGKDNAIIGIAGVYRVIEGFRDSPAWYGRFSKVIDFIRKNYASKLSLSDLARKAGVSVSQLERHFSKLLNMSVAEYIQNVRLTVAREILETTDQTVTAIALSVGFYDHSHFSRTFKQWMNCSPHRYRKNHQDPAGSR